MFLLKVFLLNHVRIPKTTGKGFVRAVFSKLDPLDPLDREAIQAIKQSWDELLISRFFCEPFLKAKPKRKDPNTFYCLELVDPTRPLAERIVCLAQTYQESHPRTFVLDTLATKPEFKHGQDRKPLKNIGQLILGAIFSEARKKKVKSVKFKSQCDKFYHHSFYKAGILREKYSCSKSNFDIDSTCFDSFIRYFKTAFGIDFSKNAREPLGKKLARLGRKIQYQLSSFLLATSEV